MHAVTKSELRRSRLSDHITSHGVDGRRLEGLYIRKIHCNISIYTFNTNL